MEKLSDPYHIYYEENRLWENTYWLGINIQKCPTDLLIMQELICDIRPDLIIETGTRAGGSALFFASICELLDHGQVISVDKTLENVNFEAIDSFPCGERIEFILGESIDKKVIEHISSRVDGNTVMVFLDSWHSEEYVFAELNEYRKFVTPGSLIVVEDTHINNPVKWKHEDKGPAMAVERFLIENHNFAADYNCEKLIFTFCPGGFLKRIY